jgi:putative transposase
MPSPHSADLRRGRVSEPGRIYLLTTVTRDRRPVFADFQLARLTIGVLRECDALHLTETLAFVLMPDHLHWLFALRGASLTASARRFKSSSSRIVNLASGQTGTPLWQTGFHDHALRREEDLHAIARYIVANPLRAGLVRTVRDYPHWDALWL